MTYIRVQLLLFLFVVMFNASAQERNLPSPQLIKQKSTDSKRLVIGVEDVAHFPLFDFKNSNESFTTELLNKFAEQYNYEFVYLPMPVKRFGMWLFEKDIDLKFPDNSRWNESEEINKLTAERLTYSAPVLDLVAGTITANPNIKSRQDVKVLGTLLGFFPTLWVTDIEAGDVTLYESSSTLMLLQQLVRGQLDAVNLEPSVVKHYLSLINRPPLEINRNFTYEVYSYHLSTIKHPEVVKNFDRFLANNETYIEDLKRKYKIIDHTPYIK